MNILVDTVRIAGFRGIADLEISLPRVAVLIGPNNAGKTSLIKALQLALGDYARILTEEDFHIDCNQKYSEEILVDVRVVALDDGGKRTIAFDDNSKKTKYAPAIAAKLCELDLEKLPPKIGELFGKIRTGVAI